MCQNQQRLKARVRKAGTAMHGEPAEAHSMLGFGATSCVSPNILRISQFILKDQDLGYDPAFHITLVSACPPTCSPVLSIK